MPVVYKIDPARHLIHTRCIGDVNPKEIANHFRELARDPNRPDWLNVLLDLTEQTSLPFTIDLRQVTYSFKELLHHVRFGACAIVAPHIALFGMMRIWEVFTRDYFVTTHVFRKLEEAEQWLQSNGVHLPFAADNPTRTLEPKF